MVSFVVKINRILMFLISFIVFVCISLLIVFLIRNKKEIEPE